MMKHVRVAIALRLQVGVDLNAANATCAIGHNNLIFWYVLKNQVEFRPRLGKKGGL
jgi:hypothetical protein